MKMEQKILDISKWQTCIDFQKVKNSGITGIMIRACYGEFEDSLFKQHIKNALAVGLKVGVYMYSLAHNSATAFKETTAFLKIVEPYEISLFCAIDMEDSIQLNTTNEQRDEIVKTFKELVEFSKNGRAPVTPKTDNEKLLVSYNNLKNSLDKAIDENSDLARQFMTQAIEFLQAKLNTNKAKMTLNYGAKKVA